MNAFYKYNPGYPYYHNFTKLILAFFKEYFGCFCQFIFNAAPILVAVCVEDKQTYTATVQQTHEQTQNLAQLRNKVVTSL